MHFNLLPPESITNILSFLDVHCLYNCLFVDRNFCIHSVPFLWREPFRTYRSLKSLSIINTLLSCTNENEISSLIPYNIRFDKQTPLFKYGRFVKKIDHEHCVKNIVIWLNYNQITNINYIDFLINTENYQDHRVESLVNVIYQIIMRQGSILQKIKISTTSITCMNINLPISIFRNNQPGIIYLDKLSMSVFDVNYKNTIEFLKMVLGVCKGIVNCKLETSKELIQYDEFINTWVNIITLQPLKKLSIKIDRNVRGENIKNMISAFEFRSETLKELLLIDIDFQQIDLSFLNKLECLEYLSFMDYSGLTSKHCEILSKKKSLIEFVLIHNPHDLDSYYFDYFDNQLAEEVTKKMIYSLCDEKMTKLSLNIMTPEIAQSIKESCPNINFLYFEIFSEQTFNATIQVISDLLFLKTLKIDIYFEPSEEEINNMYNLLNHLNSFLFNCFQ